MLSVSQYWKEKLGNYLIANRDLLTPEELVKLVYSIGSDTLTFTKEDIISFTHTNSADLNSLSLPKNEIQFEIDNTDGRFNPDNPTGLYEQITEKQEVDLYYGIVAGKYTVTNIYPDDRSSSLWTAKYFDRIDDKKVHDSVFSGGDEGASYTYALRKTVDTEGYYVVGYSNCGIMDDMTPFGSLTPRICHSYSVSGSQSKSEEYTISNPTVGTSYAHTFDKIYLYVGDTITFNCCSYAIFGMTDFYDAPFLYLLPESSVVDIPQPLLGETADIKAEEWHKAGTFYMSGWECPQNGLTAKFTASSLLDFGKDKFGEQTYSSEPTYADVCETAFSHMGISSSQYSIDSSLSDYDVPYKENTTYTVDMFKSTTDAAVIQYCANAAMCRIRYDVDGKIYVEPMETVASLSDYVIDLFTSYKSPEYTLSKQIKNVLINSDYTVALESTGENQQISNSLITSQSHANLVAGWLGRVINTRKEISGEFRCDPRLQPYDYIKSINKFAVNECFITSLTITYGGSFKANYTGRVMKSIPTEDIYGLFYAGDRQRAGNSIS